MIRRRVSESSPLLRYSSVCAVVCGVRTKLGAERGARHSNFREWEVRKGVVKCGVPEREVGVGAGRFVPAVEAGEKLVRTDDRPDRPTVSEP